MLDRTLLWSALLLVPLAAGCTRAGEGRVELDAEVTDFSAVEIGASATRAIGVRNTGTASVSLRDLKLAGAQADQFSLESPFTEIELPAGQATAIAVSFRPTKRGAAAAELSLQAGTERRTVSLRGFGVDEAPGPRIELWPQPPAAVILTPEGASRQLLVMNAGSGPLRFVKPDGNGGWREAAPEVVGDDPSEFVLTWPNGEPPIMGLAPGETVAVRIEFRPKSPGSKTVALRFYSNDAKRPVVALPINASTELPGACEVELAPKQLVFDANGSPLTEEVTLRVSP